MREAPLLNIENLNVRFGRFGPAAVEDVSITVAAGARVGIIGESGSGKSVTAMSVLRLNDEKKMTYGESSVVGFNGTDLLKTTEKEIDRVRGAQIAMIFQDPTTTLNPVFRVGKQIMDVLHVHQPMSSDQARRHVIASLDDVGIRNSESVFRSYPHQLSGGMRQRVMIAMAISARPQLLIADEPTSALDVTVQAAVLDTLDRLADERNMAVLLITHDMGVVARFCDEVHVMNAGQVMESGPTEQILTDPRHAYTRALLAAVPRVRPTS